MLTPPASIRSEFETLAETAMRGAGMDSVGLYRFNRDQSFDCGVILGMPDAFTRRYESSGIPIDPVLAEFDRHGFRARLTKPVSFETLENVLADLFDARSEAGAAERVL